MCNSCSLLNYLTQLSAQSDCALHLDKHSGLHLQTMHMNTSVRARWQCFTALFLPSCFMSLSRWNSGVLMIFSSKGCTSIDPWIGSLKICVWHVEQYSHNHVTLHVYWEVGYHSQVQIMLRYQLEWGFKLVQWYSTNKDINHNGCNKLAFQTNTTEHSCALWQRHVAKM